MFAMAVARWVGADTILAVDTDPRRLAVARALGADETSRRSLRRLVPGASDLERVAKVPMFCSK